MSRYLIEFKRTSYGCFEIQADNKKEALRKFSEGEYDEFTNKSYDDYDTNKIIKDD